MKKLLGLLFLSVVASPGWATTTSFYHIPASNFRPAMGNAQCKGACGGGFPATVGVDNKPVWVMTNVPFEDWGIESLDFVLPPFAQSTTINARVIYSDSGSSGQAGFYGFYEVTPTLGASGVWANNLAQDCAPSVTNQCNPLHGGTDSGCVIPIQTCNQGTSAFCASVAACTGTVGYHGNLQIYRDNTTFGPNLNASLNISEVVIEVTTP